MLSAKRTYPVRNEEEECGAWVVEDIDQKSKKKEEKEKKEGSLWKT